MMREPGGSIYRNKTDKSYRTYWSHFTTGSGQDILQNLAAFDSDEALVETLVGEGEFVWVDAELVENGDPGPHGW